jgi:3D-(3,5/4)-trihydroxycyclohexane-1,2-dione acylhydrolase (decyclizing)
MMDRVTRLTAGQALVRFVANRFVERDGQRHRFIAGFWGIFGHGNVAGLGQGLAELAAAEGLQFHQPQNEQAMVRLVTSDSPWDTRLSLSPKLESIDLSRYAAKMDG